MTAVISVTTISKCRRKFDISKKVIEFNVQMLVNAAGYFRSNRKAMTTIEFISNQLCRINQSPVLRGLKRKVISPHVVEVFGNGYLIRKVPVKREIIFIVGNDLIAQQHSILET